MIPTSMCVKDLMPSRLTRRPLRKSVGVQDLSQHERLGFSHKKLRTHWTLEGPDGRVTVPVSGRFMANHGEAILTAGLGWAGLGWAGTMLQPLELVKSETEAGSLVRVLPVYAARCGPCTFCMRPTGGRRPSCAASSTSRWRRPAGMPG